MLSADGTPVYVHVTQQQTEQILLVIVVLWHCWYLSAGVCYRKGYCGAITVRLCCFLQWCICKHVFPDVVPFLLYYSAGSYSGVSVDMAPESVVCHCWFL